MNDPLQPLIGKDLTSAVTSLTVKDGVTKDGVHYCYLSLLFDNGFEQRIFPREKFAIVNAAAGLD